MYHQYVQVPIDSTQPLLWSVTPILVQAQVEYVYGYQPCAPVFVPVFQQQPAYFNDNVHYYQPQPDHCEYYYQGNNDENARRSTSPISSGSISDLSRASSTSPVEYKGTVYYSNPTSNYDYNQEHNDVPLISEQGILFVLKNKLRSKTEDLIKSGYPYFEGRKIEATIQPTQYNIMKKNWIEIEDQMRTCCRCELDFDNNENGTKSISHCQYHPRALRFDPEIGITIHSCCGELQNESNGCRATLCHVFDHQYSSELSNFLPTPLERGNNDPRSKGVYAIDCEMVYTKSGPAARMSMVNFNGDLVLDMIVKPPTEVIDANTEFSGLTIEQVNEAKGTLEKCRQKMFEFINAESILIGHSLESDLKALRIVHMNVIDTAILFQTGKHKPSLRSLAQKHLGKSIQNDNSSNIGHDSEEDARTCIELVKTRIMSELMM
ncbi:unnamed protein product [Caenorhabditis angaria]|uniref:Exonuclease domain-containing protein n=1 Tax=Caenorhabditis angaria TaxID=860376 RepID=A0A9P1NAF7_9PELO|nr:unnamed protein product [Caenorhabditis angaria]